MAITGVFEADFSQFTTATKQAAQELGDVKAAATSTAESFSGLEQATATAGVQVGTLHTSYMKFDSTLQSVGIHIGPQIKAVGELIDAMSGAAGSMGLVAEAGLAVGVAIAAWDTAKWIGHVTGMDDALDEWVTHLAGAKTQLEQMTDAAEAALAHQQEMIFEAAAIAGKTTANLADAEKALADFYKKRAADDAAADAAWSKHEDAIREVNAALKDHDTILRDVSPAVQEMAKHALEAGINQSVVKDAYHLTSLEVRTLSQDLQKAKRDADAATAAQKQANADLMTSMSAQIDALKNVEKAKQGAYGIQDQIDMLEALAVKEQEVAARTIAGLTDEHDKLRVKAQLQKDLEEIDREEAGLAKQLSDQRAQSILNTINMQTQLNAAVGRDAAGAIQLPIDAMEAYRRKLEEINAKYKDAVEGTIEYTEKQTALKLAEEQLTQGLYDEAKALDVNTTAQVNNNNAKASAPSAAAAGGTAAAAAAKNPATSAAAAKLATEYEQQVERIKGNTYSGPGGGEAKAQDLALAAQYYQQQLAALTAPPMGGNLGLGGPSIGSGSLGNLSGALSAANTSPEILSYIRQGFTLNEAMSLVYASDPRSTMNTGYIWAGMLARKAQGQYDSPDAWMLEARAMGGSVTAGRPYLVGELGPELFLPKSSGAIVPSIATAGTTINVTVNGSLLSTQTELAALVQDAFMAAYRSGGNRLPV